MQGIYKFTFAIAMIIVIIIAVTILMISCNKIISQLYVRWQKCKIHQQINKNHCQLNNWKKLIKQFSSTCLPFLNVKNIYSTFVFRYSQLNYFVSKCDEFSSVSFYILMQIAIVLYMPDNTTGKKEKYPNQRHLLSIIAIVISITHS